jgi:hypothetical protein
MNLTEKQKQWVAWITMTLVVTLISIFLGITYPLPQPPPFLPDEVATLGTKTSQPQTTLPSPTTPRSAAT